MKKTAVAAERGCRFLRSICTCNALDMFKIVLVGNGGFVLSLRMLKKSPVASVAGITGRYTYRLLKYLPLWGWITALVMVPAFYISSDRHAVEVVKFLVPQGLMWGLAFTVAACLGRWVRAAVISLVAALFAIETFCWFSQGVRFTYTLLVLALQTDRTEASQFLSVSLWPLLESLGLTAISLAVWRALQRSWERSLFLRRLQHTVLPHDALALCLGVAGVGLYSYFICMVPYFKPIPGAPHVESWAVTPVHFPWLVYDLKEEQAKFDPMVFLEANRNVRAKSIYPDDPVTVVLVVGESFSKLHSSLYGYGVETNPRLARYVASGQMVVLQDIVTQSQNTIYAYPPLLSLRTAQDSLRFDRFALVPAAFKKAGYRVYLCNNQSRLPTAGLAGDFDITVDYYLADPNVHPYIFDEASDRVFAHDGDYLDIYGVPRDSVMMAVYHLQGQHLEASEKYPESFEPKVSLDTYLKRGFDNTEARRLAHYDNATRYNDLNVSRIIECLEGRNAILLYVSDHGEEIYDVGDRYGRRNDTTDPVTIKQGFEVPAMIWMSDVYMARHSDKADLLRRRAGVPLYSSDLPKTLLDMAGVEVEGADMGHSLMRDSIGRRDREVGPDGFRYDRRRAELEALPLRTISRCPR